MFVSSLRGVSTLEERVVR